MTPQSTHRRFPTDFPRVSLPQIRWCIDSANSQYCSETRGKMITRFDVSRFAHVSLLWSLIFATLSNPNACAYNFLFVVNPISPSHALAVRPLAEALNDAGHFVVILRQTEIGSGETEGASIGVDDLLADVDPACGGKVRDLLIRLDMGTTGTSYHAARQVKFWQPANWHPLTFYDTWALSYRYAEETAAQRPDTLKKIIDFPWHLLVVDSYFAPLGHLMADWSRKPYVLYHAMLSSSAEHFFKFATLNYGNFPTTEMRRSDYEPGSIFHRVDDVYRNLVEIMSYKMAEINVFRLVTKTDEPLTFRRIHASSRGSISDYAPEFDNAYPFTNDYELVGGRCIEQRNGNHSDSASSSTTPLVDQGLKAFVGDPESRGTIVVSAGHVVKWEASPDDVKTSFVRFLNRFDRYRVVWQFDEKSAQRPRSLGSHVKLMKWLPQAWLLRHSKTVLFVTHGGLKSVTEGICAGVPLLVVPIFVEQVRNGYLVWRNGLGLVVEKRDLTDEERLFNRGRLLIEDRRFRNAARRLRRFFGDKIRPPLDSGVFSLEQTIRRLHLNRRWFKRREDLNWAQINCLDAILIFSLLFNTFLAVSLHLFIRVGRAKNQKPAAARRHQHRPDILTHERASLRVSGLRDEQARSWPPRLGGPIL